MANTILWKPSAQRQQQSQMAAFIQHLNDRLQLGLPLEYHPLWQWSVEHPQEFWHEVCEFFSIIGDFSNAQPLQKKEGEAMFGAQFFVGGKLNFAENLLQDADSRPALISWNESGRAGVVSRAELRLQVLQLAGWLRENGVEAGDSVAAYMPNIAETVVTFLASASIGAVFSSSSMDFGVDSAAERLGQVSPKILVAADGYVYAGRTINRVAEVSALVARIPSIKKVIGVPVLDDNPAVGDCLWAEALASASPLEEFVRGDFNAPLVALFSSGTTGAPKCIVHRAGGVLLQHIKELGLHTNIKESDKVFYFTTCGWMMWNWLISSLALRASVVLFEGSPLHSKADILWDMVAEEQIAVFGVSAKYLDTMRKSGIVPLKTHDLSALRTICSTGAPLLADGFNYVYEKVKTDVQLASISGGTDIVSCFALGNPLDVVREGELQGRGLGLAVTVFNDDGQEILDEAGELVCTVPFPVMPLKFANDEGDSKYRAAYFEHFDGIWRHGDWAILTKAGGLIIRGRSDATLNPGGVRIGTAEIYRPVEAFEEVAEALAVGQEWMGDTRIVLFVRLATEVVLDEELRGRLSAAIRRNASPRHVPAKIIAVAELPRTRSGKIAEIAVRETIHNRPIKNVNALANPDSLECFRNLSELEV